MSAQFTIPRTCTTAASVEREAIEPTMDTIARCQRQRELLLELAGLTPPGSTARAKRIQQLADLITETEDAMRRTLGFLDTAHTRLARAEARGAYDEIRPAASNKELTARIVADIDVNGRLRRGPTRGRIDLRDLFAEHGDLVFRAGVLHQIGKARTYTLRGEYADWRLAR